MKLVIVESPTKSKTISHYLGSEYVVEASVGNIRDLAIKGKEGLGVDIENGFKPTYSIDKDKTEVVKKLKKLTKEADEVLLATDPDREGEAIAYHLASVLDLPLESTKRLEFHEITKTTIQEAIKNPRIIDLDIFSSQEARRIIDRILGFKLSKLLQKKIRSKSAGRVQSVTLGIICDREKEINAFVPSEYWTVDLNILVNDQVIKLKINDIENNKLILNNEQEAIKFIEDLGNECKVENISKYTKNVQSREPFRTSTLQQVANAYLNFKTKDTSLIAQQLYEGVETDEGLVGLITYMRTDSTRISGTFVAEAKKFISHNYGEEYFKGSKASKNVNMQQDAHECIRPTNVYKTPSSLKKYLTDKQYKLYKLIYDRTLASLMADKILDVTSVEFNANGIKLYTSGSVIKFNGFDVLKIDDEKNETLPEFTLGDVFKFNLVDKKQNFTKAPSRYTEGKLVKVMEDDGIGRPSTYSMTIQTLLARKYVALEKGYLKPTDQGILTSVVLKKYFPEIMNIAYTSSMETELDKIQDGSIKELDVLNKFYSDFITVFDHVKDEIYEEELERTGEICPECGKELVYRDGRYGKFISCIDFPRCKYIKKEQKVEPVLIGRACPLCGHDLVKRVNKKGQEFIGCSNFPKCHYIEGAKDEVLENAPILKCPNCGKDLHLKKWKNYYYKCDCGFQKAYDPKKD